ncbi:GGDEF/EAL domain-containing response regulator [Hypericibacter sp.]|uniref:GGDEF/EAL domain-containing response regulator n=1 Tax=Hypericibacter sp. TaxID=2705401 RepID=UPI003D6D1446
MISNRLLIVDFDPNAGALIAAAATASGYETATATAAGQFLQYLQLWNPAFVLLDVGASGETGMAMLRHLWETRCPALVLLMGRVADQGRLHLLQHMGTGNGLTMTGMVFKPLHRNELVQTLTGLRDSRHWLTETAVTQGLERGEFFLEYQPLVNVRSGHISSVESLIRWRHPHRGLISPDAFIPFVEASNAVGPLTRWVAMTAIAQLEAWTRQGVELDLAINLSARNLWDSDLADMILTACEAADISTSRLTLELTETAAIERPEDAIAALSRLRLCGIKLAIDDFGTGYSSLAQLRQLPFSQIKIDRSLVTNCQQSHSALQIISTVVDLARSLGLHCIAEGVETKSDFDAVGNLGCDTAQGYLISRALPADRLQTWLADWPVVPGPRRSIELLRSIARSAHA